MKFIFSQDQLEKLVNVSTRHITDHDLVLLQDQIGFQAHPKMPMESTEWYGAFMLAEEDRSEDLAEAGYSEHFIRIMDAARLAGCAWVEFDLEGRVHPELRLFR